MSPKNAITLLHIINIMPAMVRDEKTLGGGGSAGEV